MKTLHYVVALLLMISASVQAGVRTPGEGGGSNQMVARLQAMVRQATKERDALQVENTKMKQELVALQKKQSTLEAQNSEVSKKLSGVQGSHRRLKQRQLETTERLSEVITQYKTLKEQKNQLTVDLKMKTAEFNDTTGQLGLCTKHNQKLISAANELLDRYQNKGTFSGLMQSEGVLQFESVEMENIVQDYEDRIRDEKYHETAQLN